MFDFFKKNIFFVLSIFVILLILILGSIYNYKVYIHFGYSLYSLFNSIGFYFSTIFHFGNNLTFDFLPFNWVGKIQFGGGSSPLLPPNFILPDNFGVVQLWFSNYFKILFTSINFNTTFSFLIFFVFNFSIFLFIFITLVLSLKIIELLLFTKKNPKITGYSKNYLRFEKMDDKFLNPFICFIKNFIFYFSSKKYFKYPFVILICFYLNLVNVGLDIVSYLFVFLSSFNFQVLYYSFYTTLLTEWNLIIALPRIVWFIIIYLIYDLIRYKKALKKLASLDYKNRNFIKNETGVINIVKGAPGVGKTMFLTDLGKTTEQSYRYDLLDTLNKFNSYFPHFNVKQYESYIDLLKLNHVINNQSEIEDILDQRYKLFLNSLSFGSDYSNLVKYLFGYDFAKFGLEHWNGLYMITFLDFLKTYGSAYYYYSTLSPLLFSNYSIRFDCTLVNPDYFITWKYDYFTINKHLINNNSHYSHILDMDSLRLGKKFNNKTPILGFGVVCFTEFDKERGNQLSNQKFQRNSDDPNPLNDDLTKYLKLSRQVATIDYQPYFKMFTDLQRTGDLALSNVEISECIIKIVQKNKGTVLSLWKIEPIICQFIVDFRNNFINKYRSTHNSLGLIVRFINFITLPFKNYLEKRMNLFGCSKLVLEINTGDDECDKRNCIYYLLDKKILARTYSTDTHYGFFKESLNQWDIGIDDIATYSSLRASGDEIGLQHSYLGEDLKKSFRQREDL